MIVWNLFCDGHFGNPWSIQAKQKNTFSNNSLLNIKSCTVTNFQFGSTVGLWESLGDIKCKFEGFQCFPQALFL